MDTPTTTPTLVPISSTTDPKGQCGDGPNKLQGTTMDPMGTMGHPGGPDSADGGITVTLETLPIISLARTNQHMLEIQPVFFLY